MPQITAAKKALRQAKRRRAINDRWRRKMRGAVRAVSDAVTQQNEVEATSALIIAQRMLDRAVRHNVLSANTAGRKKSRLSRAVSALSK